MSNPISKSKSPLQTHSPADVPKCPTDLPGQRDIAAAAPVNTSPGQELQAIPTGAAGVPIPETGHSDPGGLDERQLEAIALLVAGYSDTHVAKEIKVDRRTIYRWRRMPHFARELHHQREALFDEAHDGLRALLPKALDVVAGQMNPCNADRAFRAAAFLLRTGFSRTAGVPPIEQESTGDDRTISKAA